MTRRPYLTLVIILLLVAFAAWVDLSQQIIISNPFNGKALVDKNVPIQLGLDLRGGTSFLLQLVPQNDQPITADMLQQAVEVIRKRVDKFGVSEPVIAPQGDRRILVLCHHGSRSRDVTEYLRAQGFPAVSNVQGGMAAWAEHIDPAMQRY